MKNLIGVSKILFCIILLSFNYKSKAQLVYLGDDENKDTKVDGYQMNKQTAGLATLFGKYYFTTPNGNIYETSGTESNTKTIKQLTPQNLPYLAATNKYLFFAYERDNSYELTKYSSKEGLRAVTISTDYNRTLKLNGNPVPGNNYLVSEIFTNYDKNTLLVRHFANDQFMIYAIEDTYATNEVNYVVVYDLDFKDITTPIDVSTEIETLNGEIYWNGRVKPTGVYETSTTIYKKTDADKRKYDFKINLSILKNKAFPYFRFLRTDKNIYSLIKVEDSVGNYHHNLFYYNNKSITASNALNINVEATDFDTQTMDGNIYVSCKGYLWLFDEANAKFKPIINKQYAKDPWQDVQKNKRFLKVGEHYLFRRDGKLYVYYAKQGVEVVLDSQALAKNSNYFTQNTIYAYADKSCFYYTRNINGKEIFTKYNPVTYETTAIKFPNFKKQNFEEIKAIHFSDDKFVFLTSYLDKKNKPVYKMFMYTEDGLSAPATNKIVEKNAVEEDKVVENNTMTSTDKKPFDAKLFLSQLNKIVEDPLNKFENIKLEFNDILDEYETSIKLEGFNESKIIDYTSNSQKIRYVAETKMYTKSEALVLQEKFEKEIKKLPFPYTKDVPYDVATRKLITYRFNGKIADIDLDLSTYADNVKDDSKLFYIKLRVDKLSK